MVKQNSFFTVLALIGVLLFTGCRSEFETARLSNDPELIFKKAMQYYEEEEWYKAQVLIELAIPYYRGRPESEVMFYRYAKTFYEQNQFILANHWFNNFSNTYPNSVYREESDWLLAYSSYLQSPSFRLDQRVSDQATQQFQEFANTYPNSDRVDECNRLMDELRAKRERKSYEQGLLYYRMRRYQAAMQSLENTLADYPETSNKEELRYYIVLSQYELAENSIYSKKKERFEKALALSRAFLQSFPSSDKAKEIKRIQKESITQIKELQDV